MRYFRLLTLRGYNSPLWIVNKIYPENFKSSESSDSVGEVSLRFPEDWQEVTEADYLAQEGIKPINEYHAALRAISDGLIQHVPDNLLDAIYNDLAEEKRRRWAISNGWAKQENN